MDKRIVLIATGGTIASTGEVNQGNLKATLKGGDLVGEIPEFRKTGMRLDILDFAITNSTNITPEQMVALARQVQEFLEKDDVIGVVITHGTSLMEETAFVLDTLISSDKPVVFTGAQRNPTQNWPDGTGNLSDALFVASSPQSAKMGVMVVFCGKIHEGRQAVKWDSAALDAFSSGEKGILGTIQYNHIAYHRPRLRKTLRLERFKSSSVAIIPFYSGADGRYLKAALDFGEEGVVVEGVGLGNVNNRFYEEIRSLCDAGRKVIITTRSPCGRLIPIYSYEGGGMSLKKLGVVFSSLPSPKARLLLMLALGGGLPVSAIEEMLD